MSKAAFGSWQRPYGVSLLAASLVFIYVLAVSRKPDETSLKINTAMGILTSVCIYLVFAALHFPDGSFIRPSLIVWRISKGATLLYLMLLVFLSFQNVDDVKKGVGRIEPLTLESFNEKSYAGSCVLYDRSMPEHPFHNFTDKIDIFVVAHAVGWFAKALILRDWTLLWLSSISFELTEICLRHVLPNFNECWWDHILMDLLGCNLLGMWIGMATCNWWHMKTYHYGCPPSSNDKRRCSWRNALAPFVSASYKDRVGGWLSSPRTFFNLCVLSIFCTVFDVNYFFLKAILKLDPGHWMCGARTLLMGLTAAPAVMEVQNFLSGKDTKLGTDAWLLFAVLVSELTLITRWGHSLSRWNEPMPLGPKLIIGSLITLLFTCFAALSSRRFRWILKSTMRINSKSPLKVD